MSLFRKCIAALFLLLVLFPLTGFVLFHYQQKQIRIDVKKAFKTKELSSVHIKQLVWYKKNKEIIVDGILFDVSSIRKEQDGTYTVTGLYDHQEQRLHALMDKATQKNQKASGLLMYAFGFVSFGDLFETIVPSNQPILSIIPVTSVQNFHPQYKPGILKPPPRRISIPYFS